jgi:hypothetical protein
MKGNFIRRVYLPFLRKTIIPRLSDVQNAHLRQGHLAGRDRHTNGVALAFSLARLLNAVRRSVHHLANAAARPIVIVLA